MNRLKLTSIILALSLAISACGAGASTPDPTQTLQAVYTAAAVTMTAQAALFTATPLPLPTDTNTPEPTATAAVTNTPAAAIIPPANQATGDLSAYQADVTIPDGTVIAAGTAFTKTWQMYNKGTTTWTTGYRIVFVSGEAMSGASTALAAEVKPGQSANISVNMVAPVGSGTKTGYWRLQNASGTYFGDQVSVQIVVGGTAGPTATVTPTGTVVATATTGSRTVVDYTVVSGDTCMGIVTAHPPMTKEELLDLNPSQPDLCQKLKDSSLLGTTIKIYQ